MTPADLVGFLSRAWPIVAVCVPATWYAAKLYYDREIRILERRLDAAESEVRKPPTKIPNEIAAPPNVASPAEPPAPKREKLTFDLVMEIQKEARAVLKGIRQLQTQLQTALPEDRQDNSRVAKLRYESALSRASKAYAAISDDVIQLRDRLLMYASPKGRVQRDPSADAQYTAPLTEASLALIERDLSLLCLSVYPDEGFGVLRQPRPTEVD